MEIIKEAFVEGRETKTPWDASNAKKNQIKAEVALENFSAMSSRERMSMIPLHMVCSRTGAILHTFPSRIAAARYIVSDILKRPDKNPLSITGNIEICMRAGWRAYGFYWKIADQSYAARSNDKDKSKVKAALPTETFEPVFQGRKVWYMVNGNEYIIDSITDAAKIIGLNKYTINRMLSPYAKNASSLLKGKMLMFYNETPQTLVFESKMDASRYLNCGRDRINSIMDNGGVINNFTIEIDYKS